MAAVEPSPQSPRILTVSQLNLAVRRVLEQNFALSWVGGEISNLTRAASGHWYFQLKDARAQVRCVMFRNRNQLLDWVPKEGMAVEAHVTVSLYEARGEFQLTVEHLRRAGLGALYEAFERLKLRLAGEGLFAPERKRPLPPFPRRIGIVTSPQAAALRDVLTTLRRRSPGTPVILYPAPVQGDGAAQRLATALDTAGARGECDVLILCRGGGSIEDLWSFNDEGVARAVARCPIPVVCGVGHETDFTIADFVADHRAPTPTAAAELCAPNRTELLARLATMARHLMLLQGRSMQQRMQHLDHLARCLVHPGQRLDNEHQHLTHLRTRLAHALRRGDELRGAGLDRLAYRLRARRPDLAGEAERQERRAAALRSAVHRMVERRGQALAGLQAQLELLNPDHALKRGFSLVRTDDGALVRSSVQVAAGDRVEITFGEGGAAAHIERRQP